MGSHVSKKKEFVSAATVIDAIPVDCEEDTNITPVRVTIVAHNKPNKPEEDSAEEYLWKIVTPHTPDFVQDQINGFVYASKAYNQYIYLRKPRNRLNKHRFESVGRVKIGNSVVSLGDCRTTSSSITRDVTCVQPTSSLKMHTLTCIFSTNGTEDYVCGGTSYMVAYFV